MMCRPADSGITSAVSGFLFVNWFRAFNALMIPSDWRKQSTFRKAAKHERLIMTDLEFINKEEEFKSSLREYIEACESWGADVRSRLLDCVHNELVDNNLTGIPED